MITSSDSDSDDYDYRDLYEGIYYCAFCDLPKHIVGILLLRERCECGHDGFISTVNYNVKDILTKHLNGD